MIHTFLPEARVAHIRLANWAEIKEALLPSRPNDIVSLEFTADGLIVRTKLAESSNEKENRDLGRALGELDECYRQG